MIALDIEASSPTPETGSILSLGALDTDEPTNQFYDECRAWKGAHIKDEALAVNGFTKEEAEDPNKKTEEELLTAFLAWANDRPINRTLVGQNPSFDRDYLKAACKRAGVEFPFADRTIDIHSITWLHMTQREVPMPLLNHHSKLNLDAALRYCGIPEEPKPHNALTGAFLHAEVFSRIAYTKKLLPDFDGYKIPWEHS